jgi:thiosulfate reductase cytochrome b subunit
VQTLQLKVGESQCENSQIPNTLQQILHSCVIEILGDILLLRGVILEPEFFLELVDPVVDLVLLPGEFLLVLQLINIIAIIGVIEILIHL